MKTPSDLYEPSSRKMPKTIPDFDYSHCDDVRVANAAGRIYFGKTKACCVGSALAGEEIGIREVDTDQWLVAFLTLELGLYNQRTNRFMPNENPTFYPATLNKRV